MALWKGFFKGPRKWWLPLVRVPLILLVICCLPAGCMMQWTGSSPPAKRHADPALLKEEVRALTENFGSRVYTNKRGLQECRAYIRERFAATGAVVVEQDYEVVGMPQANVRAFFGDRSKPRIVVGAHYDTCAINGHNHNPGADDNASGVAGLFGLARLLQHEAPEDVCVELVAYSTEEPPFFGTELMGSYFHAKQLRSEGVQVKGVLILEMIGYFSDKPGSQRYPFAPFKLFYPTKGNYIAIIGGMPDRDLIATCKGAMKGSTPMPVTSTCMLRSVGMVHLSDHRSYWPFGFESVMITDTAFYRNANYHQATDTWDTLDYEHMAQVVTGAHRAVMAVAKRKLKN